MFKKWGIILVAVAWQAESGVGQTLLPGIGAGGSLRLRPNDVAVFELQEPRHDLPCAVSPVNPDLKFDFTFHTGYRVKVPMRELSGNGKELTVLFRVIPEEHPDNPVYMVQRMRVPPLNAGQGTSEFQGNFAVGEGKYHVHWLMRDREERFCSTSWNFDARLSSKDSMLRQWVRQSFAQPLSPMFQGESQTPGAVGSGSPHVGIIANFAPAVPAGASIDEEEIASLAAILRRIGSDPRVGSYSFTACSLETQQVIFHQEDTKNVDIPALGDALRSVKFGVVDAKLLAQANTPGFFVTHLIRDHLRKSRPDALILLARSTGWKTGIPREALDSLPELDAPAFYLSYNANLRDPLWRDPVSTIVKRLRGFEFGVNRPKDLFNAWSEVMSRILTTRNSNRTKAPAL
jgi:hypothetical protein